MKRVSRMSVPHSIPHAKHNLPLLVDYLLPFRSATDKLQLTHEQVRIIKHDVKSGEIIKIVAFAGTTTLIYITLHVNCIILTDTISILRHYIVIVHVHSKYHLVYMQFREEVDMQV